MAPIGVAVVGAGYWGPNLVRNAMATPRSTCAGCATSTRTGRQQVLGRYSHRRDDRLVDAVLADPAVQAVAIATPAATHVALADGRARTPASTSWSRSRWRRRCADGAEAGRARPSERGLVAHVRPHLLLHAGGAAASASSSHAGELGDIQYVDSVRINLGLVQPDIDVLWDLAPHDLSILDFILPGGLRAASRSPRHGADPIGAGQACVGYLTLPLPQRRHRARPRQLAEPDQDPHDDHRRLASGRWSGTTSTRSQRLQHLRPGRRPRRRSELGDDERASRPRSPTGSATWWRRRCPSARRCGAMVDRVRRRDPRGPRPAAPTATPACGCSRILEAAAESLPSRRRPRRPATSSTDDAERAR